jgi:hypothetical protein
VDTTAAEMVKFGSAGVVASSYDEENVARGGMMHSDDESRSYSEDEEGVEMQHHDDHDECDEDEERPEVDTRRSKRDSKNHVEDENGADAGYGVYAEADTVEDGIAVDRAAGKTENSGWRSLFMLCSCVSIAIIIGLGAALGSAKGKSSQSELTLPSPQEAVTKKPTDSPSVAPTTSPEDFTFCYEGDESLVLDDARYSSLRSELVSSGVSTGNDFATNMSYQRKSLCWLAYGDRLNVAVSDPFIEQRYILATIYYGLNEPQSLIEQGWLSGKSECQWMPLVECDARTLSTVTRLDLHGHDFVSPLPKEMNNLKEMTYLDLSMNALSEDIMNTVGTWVHLEKLILSSNMFTSIPTNLDSLPSLTYLDMSVNEMEGTIPESLASLSGLTFLDISTNEFSQTIPTFFGDFTSLESLYLHGNDLTGAMPSEICSLRDFELENLSVDCRPPGPEVSCTPDCCTTCNFYDTDKNPFSGGR